MTKVDLKVNKSLKHFDVDELEPLQGELKKLSDENFNKLRRSILDKGFKLVLHVWQNGGVNYLIDGHQRVHVLQQMKKQGIEIPKIPCAIIEAKNYREAKETVLLAVSQYGKLDKQGFQDFVEGEDFDLDEFDFPDVDDDFFDEPEFPSIEEDPQTKIREMELNEAESDSYKETQTPSIDGAKELSADDFDNFDHQCPRCGFEWDDRK